MQREVLKSIQILIFRFKNDNFVRLKDNPSVSDIESIPLIENNSKSVLQNIIFLDDCFHLYEDKAFFKSLVYRLTQGHRVFFTAESYAKLDPAITEYATYRVRVSKYIDFGFFKIRLKKWTVSERP